MICIPLEELVPYVDEAEAITPDPDDMFYFAAALRFQCAIWSNDKRLKEQTKVPVYNTQEILKKVFTKEESREYRRVLEGW